MQYGGMILVSDIEVDLSFIMYNNVQLNMDYFARNLIRELCLWTVRIIPFVEKLLEILIKNIVFWHMSLGLIQRYTLYIFYVRKQCLYSIADRLIISVMFLKTSRIFDGSIYTKHIDKHIHSHESDFFYPSS